MWRHLEIELEKTLKGRLKHLVEDDKKALEKMLEAALKKLLHVPTTRLRELAQSGNRDQLDTTLDTLESLFELETLSAFSTPTASERRPSLPPDESPTSQEPKAQLK